MDGARLNLYVDFMAERFPDTRGSYAQEWAQWFRKGYEFHDTGEEGRAILLRLLTEEREEWAAHITDADIGDAIRRAAHVGIFSTEDQESNQRGEHSMSQREQQCLSWFERSGRRTVKRWIAQMARADPERVSLYSLIKYPIIYSRSIYSFSLRSSSLVMEMSVWVSIHNSPVTDNDVLYLLSSSSRSI